MSGHLLPACWASAAFRLRQTPVTCSYADKVTIYNCRIKGGGHLVLLDSAPQVGPVITAFLHGANKRLVAEAA